MATRKQLFHPDQVRQKIQASQLINRLTQHALSAEPIMDASQVNAAKILLGKTIPDLSATTISGDADNPLLVVRRVERVIIGAAGQDATDRDATGIPTAH